VIVPMRLDHIVIAPPDPTWSVRFGEQRWRITPVLQPWLTRPIEHMGSTAVPGLAAKNIVDMLAVVVDIEPVRGAIEPLARLEWRYAPEPGDEADRMLSFCHPTIERRSHHLHVVEARSSQWIGWLAFRDHLRSDPTTAAEYANLKIRLAAEHGHDPNARDAYRCGKAAFIAAVTAAALADERARPD
jgi:GrpB-like predicted nucleotidyltransferase (UPF0157 family)